MSRWIAAAADVKVFHMSWSGSGGHERRGYHHGNLREALVEAALGADCRQGAGGLHDRRGRAALAGVSPGAPYRHFP
ncbi:MAG: hypothetical protein WDN25_19790 [Acetobacteraceae bacterium]